jgi:hypothetical protein
MTLSRIVCLSATASLALLAACRSSAAKLPPDSELERAFRAHQSTFETLVRMMREDGKLWRISHGFASVLGSSGVPATITPHDLSAERWSEYRRLFVVAGLRDGLIRERTPACEGIFFPSAIRNVGSDSVEKGYAWLPAAPPDVRQSLDSIDLAAVKPRTVFKRLSGNWYLYSRYNE